MGFNSAFKGLTTMRRQVVRNINTVTFTLFLFRSEINESKGN
jgi:hypothetical protein